MIRVARSRDLGEDAGVQEIMGFIIMFALSAVILTVSVQSFTAAKESSDGVVAAMELRGVANRVSARVVQAAILSQEFPDAIMTVRLRVPADLAGQPYIVEATPTAIKARTLGGEASATATTYKVDSIPGMRIEGEVSASDGVIVVRYELDGGNPTIRVGAK